VLSLLAVVIPLLSALLSVVSIVAVTKFIT
jgi:hypothetical protein